MIAAAGLEVVMGMLSRAREELREAYWELKLRILVELADPFGRAFYGCLALIAVLHGPLLVAMIAGAIAQERGLLSPAWTKGVLAFYVIVWVSFFAVGQGMGEADPAPPVIDEPVIRVVYEMQDQEMSEEEVERLAGAATAVMDYGMTAMKAAVDIEERRGKRRRVVGDEEE
jgi:hypothetical protein